MRIFVTGASGWIGSAVVPELLGAGHEVVGLARSDASAQRLESAGALVQRGDLDDPDGLAKAAADSDGVIHLAFQHEVAFGGRLRHRRGGRPSSRGGHGGGPGRLRPAVGAGLRHARPDRPGAVGHRERRARARSRNPGQPSRAFGPLPHCSHCPCGASASVRRCCASPRRSTATATTGSWPPSSVSPAKGRVRLRG